MTRDDLVELLNNRAKRGAFFATIETRTDPSMRKTNNPYFGRVDKLSRVNIVCNWTYELSVNRQRTREDSEPDFVAEPRAWGTRIPHSPFVEHKGNIYLEAKVERSLSTEYLLDGRPVAVDVIRPYLSKSSAGRQELDRPVILRDYALGSIKAITLDRARHVIGWGGGVVVREWQGVG